MPFTINSQKQLIASLLVGAQMKCWMLDYLC